MSPRSEIFVSVDVETSGPIPGEFSLLSIGACAVDAPDDGFACLLKPINTAAAPGALEVSGLSLDQLARTGLAPSIAMTAFARWIRQVTGAEATPVFVGLNAPFDWSFVNYYFHRYADGNPFGHTALDIKAMYLGATGCTWDQTRSSQMVKRLRPASRSNHDALADARHQAELFGLIRQLSRQ
ncbi:3'-5' exonuclease [Pseudomonas sp. R2.Fl]|nr:3'-5' exonuclease [Pseudomonas sp. R2.Fl]